MTEIDNNINTTQEMSISERQKSGSNTVAYRVSGDSMTAPSGRSYPDGSVILVDTKNRTPESGQCVIAKINGQDKIIFKQFINDNGRAFIKPLNPSLKPITAEFSVLGVAIGTWFDE